MIETVILEHGSTYEFFFFFGETMQLVVEVEYVPEEAELDGSMYEEFRKIFDRFNFHETAGTQVK